MKKRILKPVLYSIFGVVAAIIAFACADCRFNLVFRFKDAVEESRLRKEKTMTRNERNFALLKKNFPEFDDNAKESPEKMRQVVAKYMEKASAGDIMSKCILGVCCREGIGMNADDAKANEFFLAAAQAGNATAQRELGRGMLSRESSAEKQQEAFSWIRKAADQQDPEAEKLLGICYQNGLGVKADLPKAIECFRTSIKRGNVNAISSLGYCYEWRIGVPENPKTAFDLYKKAAKQGDCYGQIALSECYLKGTGTDKDLDNAFLWIRRAAMQDNSDAQWMLGLFYEGKYGGSCDSFTEKLLFRGIRNRLNFNLAQQCFQRSADQGNSMGQYCLAAYYIWTAPDHLKAFELLKKSAAQGNRYAQERLACFYCGLYLEVKKDPEKALYWFRQAAAQGSKDAEFQLKILLEEQNKDKNEKK